MLSGEFVILMLNVVAPLHSNQRLSDLTTAAKPRAIADYDYDKKLNSQAPIL